MTILIDADGCPVVDTTIKIAVERKIDCVILCDISTFLREPEPKQSPFLKEATAWISRL